MLQAVWEEAEGAEIPLQELSRCLAAMQGDEAVVDAEIGCLFRAQQSTASAWPSSPLLKDLARCVRDVMVCYVLVSTGYTSRERFEDALCTILEVEKLDDADKKHGENTTSQLLAAYTQLAGKLPGAFPSRLQQSGRPSRPGKLKARDAGTQTDAAGSEDEDMSTIAATLPEPCPSTGTSEEIPDSISTVQLRPRCVMMRGPSAEDRDIAQRMRALSDAVMSLPVGCGELFKMVKMMQEACQPCIFGVRVEQLGLPADLGEPPAAVFDPVTSAHIAKAMRVARAAAHYRDEKIAVYRLAAKALPLPLVMDLLAFDSWGLEEVLSTALNCLEWCLQQFTGEEDWTSTREHYGKVWSRQVLLKLAEQREDMSAECSPTVLWDWLLKEGQARWAIDNNYTAAKYSMQLGSMLLVILFGHELEFLLYGAQNLSPWMTDLHQMALLAIDFMLNDLIYAELVHLDYTELAYYILRQGRYTGCWQPAPSRASIYSLGSALRSHMAGHWHQEDEVLKSSELQQKALDYLLGTAYSLQDWEQFPVTSASTIDAVLWAIMKVFENTQLTSRQRETICNLAKQVLKDFEWVEPECRQPCIRDALEKASALCCQFVHV